MVQNYQQDDPTDGDFPWWLAVRQGARFYIEVMRGMPMLVLLFYIAFVAAPALVALVNAVFTPWMDAPMRTRVFPFHGDLQYRGVYLPVGYHRAVVAAAPTGITLAPESNRTPACRSVGQFFNF